MFSTAFLPRFRSNPDTAQVPARRLHSVNGSGPMTDSPPDSERLLSILAFLARCDELKSVYRTSYIGEGRNENDAEHTCHMAIFALLFAGETGLVLDREKVFEMILVHDLVEIIAGDVS